MLARDSSCFVSSAHCFSNRLSLFCKMQQVNLKIHFYCTFQKHMNSEVQKPTNICNLRCCWSSWQTSQKTEIYFHKFKRSQFVISDWWILIHFECFCVSLLVACSSKKHYCKLSWLFNFRVDVLLKSAVI